MSNYAVPDHQIRAQFTDRTITVYQAYSSAIAEPAVAAGRFVPPFKRERMTWIKPSFLWTMYRSGWAEKPGQERILAIDITRDGLLWALAHACLSEFTRPIHGSRKEWKAAIKANPVRIQWDPERDIRLNKLTYRAIQIGLSGEAVQRYVDSWTVAIEDVTARARRIHGLVRDGKDAEAIALLPEERPFSVPDEIGRRINCGKRK